MPTPVLKPVIEGEPTGETVVFVQGWPDDRTLWDDVVAGLRDRYRCVRFNLPNYEGADYRRWGFAHEDIVEGLADLVRAVSPNRPVTVVCHDWGSLWGHWLQKDHPELVHRLVGLDVAPHMQPTPLEMAAIIAYQWWLIGAFVTGGPIGDLMTRSFARLARTPRQGAALNAHINYPYLYTWRDLVTGRAAKLFRGYRPAIPIQFIYGAKKIGRFHSDRWLEHVRSREGNQVVALESDHWVQKDPKLKHVIRDWLDATASALSP